MAAAAVLPLSVTRHIADKVGAGGACSSAPQGHEPSTRLPLVLVVANARTLYSICSCMTTDRRMPMGGWQLQAPAAAAAAA